jgi:hypothetical protein
MRKCDDRKNAARRARNDVQNRLDAMIETLPDFPALQQLANALWHKGTVRGAALLVGAGFSKYADLPGIDTLAPPLWRDLSEAMTKQLYPDAPGDAPSDPLRLAEEYRTYFGQASLDEFVRTRIVDGAWEPSPLHHALLTLPWSDILTTNWDTLLERAGHSVSEHSYDVVRSTADLPHARAPRIIKLHGSIGASDHFIIAEEDYRTYPVKFAPFVNLARQIFIENELCLLGFSGDDPNFLQWSGWVRDHLGDGSRRIYLTGVLELGAAKRKFLEARNIAPIDLAPLVRGLISSERQAAATRMLLEFLAKAKPTPVHEWEPAREYSLPLELPDESQRRFKDDDYAASLLDQAAKIWRADRDSYPGWLVCPARLREQLRHSTHHFGLLRQSSLDKLSPLRRAEILYELAWRHATAFWPIDANLARFLAAIIDPPPVDLERRMELGIAIALLRNARLSQDEDAFSRWAAYVEARVAPETDLVAEVAYQRCLNARDHLDLATLANNLNKIEGPDPIWRLRRASIHCEIGEFARASKLISEAVAELDNRQRRDRRSLWVRSRRAWVEWLAPAIRSDRFDGRGNTRWPLEFKEARCDPESEIDCIANAAATDLRKQREEEVPVVPLFEPGHYRDPTRTVRLQSDAVVSSINTLDQLMESVGLPVRLHHYGFVGSAARNAAELDFQPSVRWYIWFLRTVHSHLDAPFERYFGRLAVAQLPTEVASILAERIFGALRVWRKKLRTEHSEDQTDTHGAVERMRLLIAALSRLSVRFDEKQALASFDFAMELANDPAVRHHWLFEPIGDLSKYSVQTIPPTDRGTLALSMLEFPLSDEKGTAAQVWQQPITSIWDVSAHDRPAVGARWDNRIAQLIQAAGANKPSREEAIVRLSYLAKHNLLTVSESQAFGDTLWSEIEEGDAALPKRTGLLIHMIGELPAPQNVNPKARVATRLFETDIRTFITIARPFGSEIARDGQNFVLALIGAAQGSVLPSHSQAVRIFREMTEWRPFSSTESIDPFGASFARSFEDAIRGLIGDALAIAIVPAIAVEDLSEERALALLTLIGEGSVRRAVAALPYFANSARTVLTEIVQCVRRGIIGQSFEDVASATAAIETWTRLELTRKLPALPQQLVEQVFSAVETRRAIGLQALLQCARRLVETKKARAGDYARLEGALADLLTETMYENFASDSREAVSVSLIRTECVRLADALRNHCESGSSTATWLQIAETDPLPEVRFALSH